MHKMTLQRNNQKFDDTYEFDKIAKKVNHYLKNIIDLIKSTTRSTVFMNIRILKSLTVFLLRQNI